MNTIRAADLITEARGRASLSQRELALRAGTVQSVVARIENGQSSPTFETLTRLVSAAGYTLALTIVPKLHADPLIDAFKLDVDRTLLRRNLEKSPEERVRSLQALLVLADEARSAGIAARAKPG